MNRNSPGASGSRKRFAFRVVFALLLLLVTAAVLETVLAILRHSVALAPAPVVGALVKNLYKSNHNVIQFDRACAQWDRELLYTLRPGKCTYGNTEFSTELSINHLGLRDDEESLDGPQIVILGDSVTMGWGVQQQETFAQVLEQMSGRKVLNAGISSYGTARETRMLRRIDVSHLQYLIIQYSDNDYEENTYWVDHNYDIGDRPRKVFEDVADSVERAAHYRPGDHLSHLAYGFATRVRDALVSVGKSGSSAPAPAQEELFIRVIAHELPNIPPVPVLVTQTWPNLNARFMHGVREALANSPDRKALQRVHLVDVTTELTAADRYPLDEHPKASGHRKIAEALYRAISKLGGRR